MNVVLDDNAKKISLKRKIIYIVVLTICAIAILVGAYIQVFRKNEIGSEVNNKYVELPDEQYIELENGFSQLFKNNINKNSDFDLSKVERINENEDIIGSEYVNTDKETNKYTFNVNIPYINIKSPTIQKYNNQILSIFRQKALDIIEEDYDNNTIYTVEYTAYINDDILSLVIRSTLKELLFRHTIII